MLHRRSQGGGKNCRRHLNAPKTFPAIDRYRKPVVSIAVLRSPTLAVPDVAEVVSSTSAVNGAVNAVCQH
jgi:hypothetical protein